MNATAERTEVLFAHGASLAVVQELLAFNAPLGAVVHAAERTLPDLHLAVWEEYARAGAGQPLFDVLRRDLVQLNFPIAAGISHSDAYRRAVQTGQEPPAAGGLVLARPDALRLTLHRSPAGVVPVLQSAERSDFVALVQALTRRNEPEPVPDSMGSALVTGYVNWGRIRRLQAQFVLENGLGGLGQGWRNEFRDHIVPHRPLYQDTFLLLSEGPYSGVPAAALGLDSAEWHALSLRLRREHECAHLFLLQRFGRLGHTILEELIGDFHALLAVTGSFRTDWFLHFYGLEAYPHYRPGGRLENYRRQSADAPGLSDDAFAVLQALVVTAAERLATLSRRLPDYDPPRQKQLLLTLAQRSLEELAGAARVKS